MCKILSILNVKISFHSPSTFKFKMNVQNSFHSHISFFFTNVNVNVQNSFHLPYDPNSWWCNVNVNVNVKKTLPKLPSLRNFAIHFHKHNLHQIKQITWWEFIIANGKVVFGTTTGIVVFVVTLVLFMLIVTCRKRTKKQTDTNKQDALLSENCSMPWLKREVTVDKMEFRHNILELLRTRNDDVTTHGKLNPADTKLFNIVSKAVEKADKKAKQWLCADAKTQQDLMFEIGFILYEDLAKRMCACAFPVHVCVNDVTRAPAKHDGYRRMEQYLRDHVAKPTPSAPDAIELCN